MALAERQGAARITVRAEGFRIDGGRLRAVRANGDEIACDAAVIAAGTRSAVLARAAGDAVSLESERGHHAVTPDPEASPRLPLMPSDGKMAITMMNGADGVFRPRRSEPIGFVC